MALFTQPSPLNCTPSSLVRIKFSSVSVNSGGLYLCTYDETGWRDFDIPTVVEMESIKATNQNEKPLLFISIAALLAAVVVGAIGFTLSRKIKT
jgi:hypothetical protein